jgi:hypothetical protein
MWEDLFLQTAHSGPHKRPLSLEFFYEMPDQNKTKGSKKTFDGQKSHAEMLQMGRGLGVRQTKTIQQLMSYCTAVSK